jgi:hypothetical protein
MYFMTMSSLDDEDHFGLVGAPQLTASTLGLSALSAMIGFVRARVHSRHCMAGYNAWPRRGRGWSGVIAHSPLKSGPPPRLTGLHQLGMKLPQQ